MSLLVLPRRATTASELAHAQYVHRTLGGSFEGSLPKNSFDLATPASPLVYVSVRPRHRPPVDADSLNLFTFNERFVCLCDATREEIQCVDDAQDEANYLQDAQMAESYRMVAERERKHAAKRAAKRKQREEGELRASDPGCASGAAAAHVAFTGWAVRKRQAGDSR